MGVVQPGRKGEHALGMHQRMRGVMKPYFRHAQGADSPVPGSVHKGAEAEKG